LRADRFKRNAGFERRRIFFRFCILDRLSLSLSLFRRATLTGRVRMPATTSCCEDFAAGVLTGFHMIRASYAAPLFSSKFENLK
jgi:hypothetical protein